MRVETPITIVMAYYDNPGMLRRHYDSVRAMSPIVRGALHLVVVDDCSPGTPAYPEDLLGAGLQIYRLRRDVRWNQDACRNVGVNHSETEWVLLTDIDHLIPEATLEHLMGRGWDPTKAYKFHRVSEPDLLPYKPHPNSWFMTRALYDAIGGYDERFAGLYGTDGDFRERLALRAEIKMIKADIVRVPRSVTPDASTTTYLRKQPGDREGIARVKSERARIRDWKPLRGRFKYDRTYPQEAAQ